MAGTKSSKKDLESKIAELEEKLAKLATQFETRSTPPPAPKPAPAPEKPTTTPPKPAPAPEKPTTTAPPPKPAPKPEAQPATELAIWEQWKLAPMTDTHAYKAKVTGYTPAPNRYYASLHTTNVDVPTSDWNLQKAKVTGYTQPSNKYFATRQSLAYHPTDKRHAGYGIRSTGTAAQTTTAPPPKPGPPPAPEPKPTTQASSESQQKSRKEQLEAYEKEYLARLQQTEQQREEKPVPQPTGSTRGSLPKGFEPKPVEAPKPNPSKGTMPKDWKPS